MSGHSPVIGLDGRLLAQGLVTCSTTDRLDRCYALLNPFIEA
jgi:hypothetical protein